MIPDGMMLMWCHSICALLAINKDPMSVLIQKQTIYVITAYTSISIIQIGDYPYAKISIKMKDILVFNINVINNQNYFDALFVKCKFKTKTVP